MVTEKDFISGIEEIRASNKECTFAEMLGKTLKDKVVEVYIGDSYEDIKYDDSTTKYPAVLVGKIVAAYAECLVLNCIYVDQVTKKMNFGNIVCLNERAIRTLTEVDDRGLLIDTFLSSRNHAKMVKDFLASKAK
jgi:hypothetical protein